MTKILINNKNILKFKMQKIVIVKMYKLQELVRIRNNLWFQGDNKSIKTEEFKGMLILLEMPMLEQVLMICRGSLDGETDSKGLINKETNLIMKNLNELILQVGQIKSYLEDRVHSQEIMIYLKKFQILLIIMAKLLIQNLQMKDPKDKGLFFVTKLMKIDQKNQLDIIDQYVL